MPERPQHRRMLARQEQFVPIDPVGVEYHSKAEEGGFDVRQILGIVRRHLWIIVGAVVISVTVAAYLVHRESQQYQATAVIRLVDRDAEESLSGGAPRSSEVPTAVASELIVLKGRDVLGDAVDRTNLRLFDASTRKPASIVEEPKVTLEPNRSASIDLEFGPLEVTYASGEHTGTAPYGTRIELPAASFVVPDRPKLEKATLSVVKRDTAINYVARALEVTPHRGTTGIDVSFKSTEPRVAVRAVNETVRAYQDKNAEMARQNVRRRRLFLEEQLRETDSLLMQAQLNLSGLRSREQAYSAESKFSSQQSNLVQIEMRQAELRTNLQMYQSLLNSILEAQETDDTDRWSALVSLPGITNNAMVAQLHSQLLSYRNERDTMLAGPWGRAESHPEVQRLDSLIKSTEERLIQAVRSHITSVGAQIAALDRQRGWSAGQMSDIPEMEVQETYFSQNLEALRQTADRLREQYEEVRLEEAGEAGQVEIVQLASFAAPLASNRWLKLLFGLVAGILVGAALAMLREKLDDSISNPEEIEDILLVPNLAVIPRTRSLVLEAGREEENGRVSKDRGRKQALDEAMSAEAYRILRTNLLFSADGDVRTLVVTSAAPGEGKTMTAVNLAIAYARQEKRVLLMGCDLRRPNLQRFFENRNRRTLIEVLRDDQPWSEAVQPSSIEGLDVLLGGEDFQTSSELISSHRMKRILDELSREYDIVILDSSPLLVAADAIALGAIVDGVLLVVRATDMDRGAVQRAMRQLALVGARVVGTVLNDPEGRVDLFDSYYEYYGERTVPVPRR